MEVVLYCIDSFLAGIYSLFGVVGIFAGFWTYSIAGFLCVFLDFFISNIAVREREVPGIEMLFLSDDGPFRFIYLSVGKLEA